jgi:hypothetical protein
MIRPVIEAPGAGCVESEIGGRNYLRRKRSRLSSVSIRLPGIVNGISDSYAHMVSQRDRGRIGSSGSGPGRHSASRPQVQSLSPEGAHSATVGGARGRDDGWVFNGWVFSCELVHFWLVTFAWYDHRAGSTESGFYAVGRQDDRWRHLRWNKSSKIFETVQFK